MRLASVLDRRMPRLCLLAAAFSVAAQEPLPAPWQPRQRVSSKGAIRVT